MTALGTKSWEAHYSGLEQAHAELYKPSGGAATQLTQLLLDGNSIVGHTVQDVTIGATTKNCFILPQAANNYSYSDASNNCVKLDSNNGGALTFTGASGFLPSVNGSYPLGGSTRAWSETFAFHSHLMELTAPPGAFGQVVCYGDPTSHTQKCSYNGGSFFNIAQTISSGTAAMTTAPIRVGTCGTTVTVAANGVATTDVINIAHNAAATNANGGILILNAWPTANNVNFNYCNSSAGTITPTATTVNWQVSR